jgi:glycosyltransferase involved in cell wall biosynthesis
MPVVALRAKLWGKPLVISPRGSLIRGALERHSWRKQLYMATLGKASLRATKRVHATSESEAKDLSAIIDKHLIRTIANGVHVEEAALPVKGEPESVRTVLFLGRLHPYKRIELILNAFARIALETPGGTRLVIAGAGSRPYVECLKQHADRLDVSRLVNWPGQVSGVEKSRILREATALVLSSQSENFGMVVAEALAQGTPCVVTKTAPWEGLEREKCGYWVEDSEEALADGMRRMMALSPEERRAMGERGRAWMARDFSWESAAKRMLALYEELIEENRVQALTR